MCINRQATKKSKVSRYLDESLQSTAIQALSYGISLATEPVASGNKTTGANRKWLPYVYEVALLPCFFTSLKCKPPVLTEGALTT